MKKSRKFFISILLSFILSLATVASIYIVSKPSHSHAGTDSQKETSYDKEKTSYNEDTYKSGDYTISSKGYSTSSKEEHDKILKQITDIKK